VLRVETRAAEPLPDGAVFETLVRFDEHGDPQPWLATSWTHDPGRKKWVFAARANVVLHSGAAWSPRPIEVADDRPLLAILRDLARPSAAVRGEDGAGTGPFRVAGHGPALQAHDLYWAGRPYLDAVEIRTGRTLKDQEIDLEAGKTDVAEILPTDSRRMKQKGLAISSTQPLETLALVFENPRVSDAAREALALSIDRGAIHSVLLQKQGEASGALLPRWLSGYSFVFPTTRNVARAKQLAASLPLAFAYDRQDALLRPIGERIAVNASEAGVTLRNAPGPADVRLVRLPITSRDAVSSLEDIAAILKIKLPEGASEAYEIESGLLSGFRVIPLVHLPQVWATRGNVRNWPQLADVWLEQP
jgi:MarR-like DNA-binding transcriptional regulator SgrR of sgrS sRNA